MFSALSRREFRWPAKDGRQHQPPVQAEDNENDKKEKLDAPLVSQ